MSEAGETLEALDQTKKRVLPAAGSGKRGEQERLPEKTKNPTPLPTSHYLEGIGDRSIFSSVKGRLQGRRS